MSIRDLKDDEEIGAAIATSKFGWDKAITNHHNNVLDRLAEYFSRVAVEYGCTFKGFQFEAESHGYTPCKGLAVFTTIDNCEELKEIRNFYYRLKDIETIKTANLWTRIKWVFTGVKYPKKRDLFLNYKTSEFK